MQTLKVAVVGAGFMGEMQASIFAALPQVELVGVTDLNVQRAQALGARLGVQVFESVESMLQSSDIEAVSICVSDAYHLAPVVAAARAKKHIFLEKPVASNLEEGKKIVAAAEENGVRLTVGHLLRYDPRYLKLKKELDSGALGEPISVWTRRNSPICDGPARYGKEGCLTLHVAVHDIDLVLWMTGQKVTKVYAERASIALKDIGVDDAVFATLKFESGTIASLEYSWVLPATFPTHIDAKMQVIGTKGYGAIDCSDAGLRFCGSDGMIFPDLIHWPEIDGRYLGTLREELSGFADAILYDKPFAITPNEAVEAVRVALMIMKSLDSGHPVVG